MVKEVEYVEAARDRLNWAVTPKEIDSAIYALMAAELALSNYVEKEKEKEEKE